MTEKTETLRSTGRPLVVSTDSAAQVCGLSPERFREMAEAMKLVPVFASDNGRRMWALPEIVERLKNWTAWDDNRRREEAVVVDVGRTRAPRQAFMKNKVKKG